MQTKLKSLSIRRGNTPAIEITLERHPNHNPNPSY